MNVLPVVWFLAASSAMQAGAPAPGPQKAAGQSLVADTTTPSSSPAPAAAKVEPSKPISLQMRGDIAMARKMYREAIDYYRAATPESAIAWNKIGIAYHHLGDMEQAKRAYSRALKLDPKYAEALNNIGTVYYAQRSYRRAVSQYNKALKLSPNSAGMWSNLGTAWFARKNYKRAAELYAKALALDPEVFEHRSTAGTLLQERSVGERAKFHFYLAKTYAHAGMNERALQYMRMALEEGFTERKRFVEDPEFANLQQLPEFQELLALRPRVL
ncbi:MAG TPA: tetratricopeptide repeat protein [Bryobacteraceae bacterium]|jgi:tetratricopeptide (TPR) repeat protein|nr:tetratricopeptide repeat protein [Bryobacteraceae bacterium]